MPSRRDRFQPTVTSVLDTLFPPVCPSCGRRGRWVCDDCWPTVPPLEGRGCLRCGALGTARCLCASLPDELTTIGSAYPFEGWVRGAIHAFKYEGERARARHLGDLLLPLLTDGQPVDSLVPVPLHPRRLRDRGYNQARLLADRLSASAQGVPVVEIARSRATAPQVDLSSAERVANVAGAFAVPNPDSVSGRHVVLIDDVVTTASTMVACAEALVAAQVASVRCLSVARAV